MDQVRLGSSGLHVSRVCLGMMSYGNDSDRPWVLDERSAARPRAWRLPRRPHLPLPRRPLPRSQPSPSFRKTST